MNIWLTRSSHSRSNITTHDLYFATVSSMITLLPKDGPLVSLNPLKVLTIKWKMSCRPYRNNRDQEAKNDVGILGEGTEREGFQPSKNKSLYSSSSCYQKAGSQKAKNYIWCIYQLHLGFDLRTLETYLQNIIPIRSFRCSNPRYLTNTSSNKKVNFPILML